MTMLDTDDRPLVTDFNPDTGRPLAPEFVNDDGAAVVVTQVELDAQLIEPDAPVEEVKPIEEVVPLVEGEAPVAPVETDTVH